MLFQPALADPKPGFGSAAVSSNTLTLLVKRTRAPELLQHSPAHIMSILPHTPHPASGISHQQPGGHGRPSAPPLHPPVHPGSIRQSSTITEVWDTAQQLEEKLDMHHSTQLRCLGPRSLVVALRALKRARKLIRLSGDFDMMVVPVIVTDHGAPMICFNCWRKNLSHTSGASDGTLKA